MRHAKLGHPGIELRNFAGRRADLQPQGIESALLGRTVFAQRFDLRRDCLAFTAQRLAFTQKTTALCNATLLGFAEELHHFARAIEIFFVVRQGDCRGVMSVAKVVEFFGRTL